MFPANPTAKTYAALNRAFDFFNALLFGGELLASLVNAWAKPGVRLVCGEPMAAEEAEG